MAKRGAVPVRGLDPSRRGQEAAPQDKVCQTLMVRSPPKPNGRRRGVSNHETAGPRSRGMICPGCANNSMPSKKTEGAGNAGRSVRPQAAYAMVVVERTRVRQVTPEKPGIPRAMVYGLYRALPGDRAFLPPALAGMPLRT